MYNNVFWAEVPSLNRGTPPRIVVVLISWQKSDNAPGLEPFKQLCSFNLSKDIERNWWKILWSCLIFYGTNTTTTIWNSLTLLNLIKEHSLSKYLFIKRLDSGLKVILGSWHFIGERFRSKTKLWILCLIIGFIFKSQILNCLSLSENQFNSNYKTKLSKWIHLLWLKFYS